MRIKDALITSLIITYLRGAPPNLKGITHVYFLFPYMGSNITISLTSANPAKIFLFPYMGSVSLI